MCNNRKLQHKTWPTDKKLLSNSHGNIFTNTMKRKRIVSNFFHFRVNMLWAPCPRHVFNSKTAFFWSSLAKNTYAAPAGPPGSPYYWKIINRYLRVELEVWVGSTGWDSVWSIEFDGWLEAGTSKIKERILQKRKLITENNVQVFMKRVVESVDTAIISLKHSFQSFPRNRIYEMS